jgi:diguanylate cyclase (GGDEF)-like protein
VMLAQLSKDQADAVGQARSVGEKILAAISQGYDLAGTPWQLTASIGVSVFVDGQLTAEEILKRADQAMYLAKAQGRNMVCIADQGIEPGADQSAERRALTSAV